MLHIGKDRKDSIDWIVSDQTAHLFVECKTKRMRLSSKIALVDTASLDADVAKIAEFLIQTYKALDDAKAGCYPYWQPNDLPIYPLIVLLEDWYLFDPRLDEALETRLTAGLVAVGIDPLIIKASPFSICSSGEFEILVQVIAMTGIADVMQKKHVGERTKWNMNAFLTSDFGEQVKRIDRGGLFRDVLDDIHPAISHPVE